MNRLNFYIECLLSFLIIVVHVSLQAKPDASVEEVFTRIYDNKIWGIHEGMGCSGGGSSIEATEEYRQFLEAFLQIYQIESVVDAGCGDWEFSKEIDWSRIDYMGVDVVASVIANNVQKYGNEHITFVHGDILALNLPPADLLICKEVLQHLSNVDVRLFIHQLEKYKYSLITNDVDGKTRSSRNRDISRGDYRPIDLTQPPFLIKGSKVLTYKADGRYKQLLLIIRDK